MATILQIQNLSFSYPGSSIKLFENLNLDIHPGWTAIIGENGSGKSTLVKLICRLLTPEAGTIQYKGSSCYCPQNTDSFTEDINLFRDSYDNSRYHYQGYFCIKDEWFDLWANLSWGERKRIHLAAALWKEADILVLDEPTNHLDLQSRNQLLEILLQFKGIGLLISHDRHFIDQLCGHSLSLLHGELKLRKGGYSLSINQKQQEEESIGFAYNKLTKERKKLHKEMVNRRQEASRADSKRSKKGLHPKDHDSKAKINLARISGKDGHAGKLLNQLNGRFNQLESKMENLSLNKKRKSGISINNESSKKNRLFFSDEQTIFLGESATLFIPEIAILRNDKIAISGPNGTGKTSFLNFMVKKLSLPKESVLFIPQEITQKLTNEIKARFENLSNSNKGRILSEISRLGSSPDSFMDSLNLSPGECKKLLFAFGIINKAQLIIMDEPTNHLDINSIACLEEALKNVECAVLIVTHDQLFMENICKYNWEIQIKNDGYHLIT
ncbi:MAG: ABC-F family ATP-binding cassette domain-containing protein [Spirochaetales bacterium]|nr:ABC-F family ATP-binding cassette domain-containing protein [Spirochaetales bacterium]